MNFDSLMHFAVLADYRITALVIMYFLYLVAKAKEINTIVRIVAAILLVIEIISTGIVVYTQFTY